jgi:hypothetical protein
LELGKYDTSRHYFFLLFFFSSTEEAKTKHIGIKTYIFFFVGAFFFLPKFQRVQRISLVGCHCDLLEIDENTERSETEQVKALLFFEKMGTTSSKQSKKVPVPIVKEKKVYSWENRKAVDRSNFVVSKKCGEIIVKGPG